MANKLRDIFSDDDFYMNCTLRFSNDKAREEFLSALEHVQTSGDVVTVDGITAISETIQNASGKYPIGEISNITDFSVGPAIEPYEIEIQHNKDTEKIILYQYQTIDHFVLQSPPNSIIHLKFSFSKNEDKHTLTIKTQYKKAISLTEIIEAFDKAQAILSHFYKSEGEFSYDGKSFSISDIKKYFNYSAEFFKRLDAVADKFKLTINPETLNDIPDEIRDDIEELYLLACQKRVLKLNAKINASEITSTSSISPNDSLHIGDILKISILGTISFQIFDHTITLFTTNLLINAVIKDIQNTNENLKILYGDTDSKPMYVSYMAFITEEEAEKELKLISTHEDDYIYALTKNDYIRSYLK